MNNEVKIMVNLDHKNIVNYIDYGQEKYNKPKGSKTVDYIAIELAEKGELFDFISNSGAFSEELARYFFI